MFDRRTFLTAVAASALVPALPSAAGAALPQVAVRRYGEFFIVDGWVLTRRDLKALGLDAG